MADVLFDWPTAAKFGRVVPKSKFTEQSMMNAGLREKFKTEVQKIVWECKLAEPTTRLKATAAVPEIQVFRIEAKSGDVSEGVLAAIDRFVLFPVVFEIISGDMTRTVAAYKTVGSGAPKQSAYFSSSWVPNREPRAPMPIAIDLPALYEALLGALMPVARRSGETVSDAAARMEQIKKVQREISSLERKLSAEPQLNRKIELRRQIHTSTATLKSLTDPS